MVIVAVAELVLVLVTVMVVECPHTHSHTQMMSIGTMSTLAVVDIAYSLQSRHIHLSTTAHAALTHCRRTCAYAHDRDLVRVVVHSIVLQIVLLSCATDDKSCIHGTTEDDVRLLWAPV